MPESKANDLDILLAFREVTVGKEVIPVREFSFMQGLRLGAAITPLVEELVDRLGDYRDVDDVNEYMGILLEVFGNHEQLTTLLIAESTGKPVEWVAQLGNDGEDLLLTMWTVNRAFFLRRVLAVREQMLRLMARL